MKLLPVNMYSQRNLIQKSVTFREIDEWPDDPWNAEKEVVDKKVRTELDKLYKQHKNNEISDRCLFKETDALYEWARKEKNAIMEKYRKLCINYQPEEFVVKKPFWKRLLHIK